MSTDATDNGVSVEQSDDLLTLTLDRPRQSNALGPATVEALLTALSEAENGGVRCCVIRAEGKNFCAGFDLADIATLSDGDLLWRFLRIETLLQAVHHAPFPIMALARGHVVGAGADLFAACWQRIAAPDCRFKMPGWNFELALGTRRLTRLVGSDAARELLIDTATADAERALQIGLASDIVVEDAWPEQIERFATRSRALSPDAAKAMLALTAVDSREQDIAAIVATAGRPGLKARVNAYRERVAAQRAARRS